MLCCALLIRVRGTQVSTPQGVLLPDSSHQLLPLWKLQGLLFSEMQASTRFDQSFQLTPHPQLVPFDLSRPCSLSSQLPRPNPRQQSPRPYNVSNHHQVSAGPADSFLLLCWLTTCWQHADAMLFVQACAADSGALPLPWQDQVEAPQLCRQVGARGKGALRFRV